MMPSVITLGVLACALLAAWAGMWARQLLPESHLSADSKDAVKVAIGLIATMSALVLGLLIASAKTSYDTQNAEIRQLAVNIALLDRLLAAYGPETQDTRELLKRTAAKVVDEIWREGSTRAAALEDPMNDAVSLAVFRNLQLLSAPDDVRRGLKQEMLDLTRAIAKTRWQLISEEGSAIPMPFLAVLVFWLMILFGSFGLFAPENATVIAAFVVCALSVAGAVFLILELDRPFEGIMQVSSEPLRKALAQ
jgi:Protein of unknown function (DUF4239)